MPCNPSMFIQDTITRYPYCAVNLSASLLLGVTHFLRRDYNLVLLTAWNLLIVVYTPIEILNLNNSLVCDSQIALTFLTSIVISYSILKEENRKSLFSRYTYVLSFIIILIFVVVIIPDRMMLNSISTIYDRIKFDHIYIVLTLIYVVDAITKFAFTSDFTSILIQGIWTYNSIVIIISMWFIIYSKDTLFSILKIIEQDDSQNTSFVTSFIISSISQLEEDYQLCSQGKTALEMCLKERNTDNLQSYFIILKTMVTNCWSILNLVSFVLIPTLISCIYNRKQLLSNIKQFEAKADSVV